MPIDNPSDRGSEKDGSQSLLYCRYCYKEGKFRDPGLTLESMKQQAITEMKKKRLPDSVIDQTLDKLSGLLRWKKKQTG